MNYADFPDIQTDEFYGTKFGDRGQLEVVGWYRSSTGRRLEIVKCVVCKLDREMWGDGLFQCNKGNLLKGVTPCGCSVKTIMSLEQNLILAKRYTKGSSINVLECIGKRPTMFLAECGICYKDKELFPEPKKVALSTLKSGIGLGCLCDNSTPMLTPTQWTLVYEREAKRRNHKIEWIGKWVGSNKTHLSFNCNCGNKITTKAGIYLNNKHSGKCSECLSVMYKEIFDINPMRRVNQLLSTTYSYEKWEAIFRETGQFNDDDIFTFKERVDNKTVWSVTCSQCGDTNTAKAESLRLGTQPCNCNSRGQRQAYINTVSDGETILAVKFGISKNHRRRVKRQDSLSVYTISPLFIYNFKKVEDCKTAERECLSELECAIIPKTDMPDGYTETTYCYNIEKIQAIYKKHGGELVH